MEKIKNKTQFYRFLFKTNNMDFYKHVWYQQIPNRSTILNYTARYQYSIKTSKKDRVDKLELTIILIYSKSTEDL